MRGTEDVDNFESMVVVMVALAMSGLATVAFTGWWVSGAVQSGTEALESRADGLAEKADAHGDKLGAVSTELRHARMELSQLRAEVGRLRAEVELAIHGPPSMRSPGITPEVRS